MLRREKNKFWFLLHSFKECAPCSQDSQDRYIHRDVFIHHFHNAKHGLITVIIVSSDVVAVYGVGETSAARAGAGAWVRVCEYCFLSQSVSHFNPIFFFRIKAYIASRRSNAKKKIPKCETEHRIRICWITSVGRWIDKRKKGSETSTETKNVISWIRTVRVYMYHMCVCATGRLGNVCHVGWEHVSGEFREICSWIRTANVRHCACLSSVQTVDGEKRQIYIITQWHECYVLLFCCLRLDVRMWWSTNCSKRISRIWLLAGKQK